VRLVHGGGPKRESTTAGSQEALRKDSERREFKRIQSRLLPVQHMIRLFEPLLNLPDPYLAQEAATEQVCTSLTIYKSLYTCTIFCMYSVYDVKDSEATQSSLSQYIVA
jgi:hypothetical protein